MNIKDLLKEDSIILNEHSSNKEEVIDTLIDKHFECHHITDKEKFKQAIMSREKLSSTGVGHMIAIPHAQNETVKYPSLVAMVDKDGVDFDSLDKTPVKLIFMIAVPKEGGTNHLEILAELSQILMDDKIIKNLINAQTPKHFIDILTSKLDIKNNKQENDKFDVVAVTACPTGIAHTYMAAKSLEETALKMGVKIKVETNGASGVKNKLTKKDIEHAKAVIIAADKKVEMTRFSNKNIIQVPVAEGIHEPQNLIEQAMNYNEEERLQKDKKKVEKSYKKIKNIYNHFMNGVSRLIPILMIYGIISQIMIMLGIDQSYYIYNDAELGWFMNLNLENIPWLAIMFSGCLFSAFIAESISEIPGFTVALFSSFIYMNHNLGIIGMIVIGFVSGYLVLGLKKLFSYIPELMDSLVPNYLLPLSGFAIMTIILTFLPQRAIDYQYQDQILVLSPILLIIIGFVLGAMMSIDMGGPINKIAYSIGIIGILLKRFDFMSAVMVAGMIPPIVIWLSIMVYPQLFNKKEKSGKWRCLVRGLCFVSEEAIPYMINDKRGIHFPCIIASGIAGALSMFFGCSQMFPHGGIATLPFITKPHFFMISIFASTLIGMSFVLLFKKNTNNS